jgi:hypothetical protein
MGVGIEHLNSMQRIRIGLTGLAFVFLLVLLGTAISRNSGEPPANGAANSAEPNEPLAELGVAPGQVESTNETNTPANGVP